MQDIHDIYGPYSTPLPAWFFLLVILGVLILLSGLLGGIYYWKKNQKKEKKPTIKQKTFSPAENLHIAVLKLKKDLQSSFADVISKQLAQEVRIYLRDAGYTNSLKRTTNETRRALKKTNLKKETQKIILDILVNADAVKFAEKDASRARVTLLLEDAGRI